jgi:hypothetical protein
MESAVTDRQQIYVWAASAELLLADASNSALYALEHEARRGCTDWSRGLLLGIENLFVRRALAELHRLEQAA